MVDRRILNNKRRRLTKKHLSKIDNHEQKCFDKWLGTFKSSKHSQQQDLPSSQIPSKMSLIDPNIAQLFVVIDTCSIVSYRTQLIDFVVRFKELHPKNSCPIRFIVSLVVLEELDKCNRPSKRRSKGNGKDEVKNQVLSQNKSSNNNNSNNNFNNNGDSKHDPTTDHVQDHDLVALISRAGGKISEPPRMFMRFVEEEMRSSEILISELDPYKETKVGVKGHRMEIITTDDRILECCLRSQSFIESHDHHPQTKVILVTEDNVFKSKATTFDVVSYRWCEFETKFKNFGLRNYISTPMVVAGSLRQQGLTKVPHIDSYWDILKDTPEEESAKRKLEALRGQPNSDLKPKRRAGGGSEVEIQNNDEDIEIVKEIIILK